MSQENQDQDIPNDTITPNLTISGSDSVVAANFEGILQYNSNASVLDKPPFMQYERYAVVNPVTEEIMVKSEKHRITRLVKFDGEFSDPIKLYKVERHAQDEANKYNRYKNSQDFKVVKVRISLQEID